jgi:hypothetical protein
MRRWPNPRSFTLARSERNELAGDAVAKHWISSRPQHRRTLCQTCFASVPVRSPGLRRELLLTQQCSTYRLTWMLVPPPGPPRPASPVETTLTQSASLSLKYEVSLALRRSSRLFCGVPEAAVVN